MKSHRIVGVGYRFDWGDRTFAYRNLAYSADSDQKLQRFRVTGPALAVAFTW
jgi:hypothetical protein